MLKLVASLKGWWAFVLDKLNTKQTRLIVRTHGRELPSLKRKIDDFFGTPLHYIMEKRMLMEIKTWAEAGSGVQLPSTLDIYDFLLFFCQILIYSQALFIKESIALKKISNDPLAYSEPLGQKMGTTFAHISSPLSKSRAHR